MTLSKDELDFLEDQQKVLNFCLDQIVCGNEAGFGESKKEPYSVVALMAIQHIVQLLELSNELQPA